MLSQTLSLVDCLKLCIQTIRSVINRLKRQNSLTIIFMKTFLVDQTITLILISQTIKYLISILIEIECILYKHLSNINSNKASARVISKIKLRQNILTRL